jgi:hypothetical protein
MTNGDELPLETWHYAWEYIKEKMAEYEMSPAEVLHILMNYCTRNDYGEILTEIRTDMQEQEYPEEVANHLSKEQVGEFIEFDNWIWDKEEFKKEKKLFKKYRKIQMLLENGEFHPDFAHKAFSLGLHYIGEGSFGWAAEHWNLTRQQFAEVLKEHGLRDWVLGGDGDKEKPSLYDTWKKYPYRKNEEARILEPDYDHTADMNRRLDELIDSVKKKETSKIIVQTVALKNGEEISFETELSEEAIKNLPQFPNQHQFYKYFVDRDLAITIRHVRKPPLVQEDKNDPE